MFMAQPAPKVLAFDVFGTVVDWHGSIVREMAALHPQVDGDAFALAWRAGYQPAMQRVRSGQLGWTRIDELHRLILDEILPRFGLQHLGEAERAHLNRVWHRLSAWPDAVAGLDIGKNRLHLTQPTLADFWIDACLSLHFFHRSFGNAQPGEAPCIFKFQGKGGVCKPIFGPSGLNPKPGLIDQHSEKLELPPPTKRCRAP
jgi:HAD superfamily hydrolase (TIGR01493 family)